MNQKQTKVVQTCADCEKETTFLEGTFFTLHYSNNIGIVIFICEHCHPNKKRFEQIAKKELAKVRK